MTLDNRAVAYPLANDGGEIDLLDDGGEIAADDGGEVPQGEQTTPESPDETEQAEETPSPRSRQRGERMVPVSALAAEREAARAAKEELEQARAEQEAWQALIERYRPYGATAEEALAALEQMQQEGGPAEEALTADDAADPVETLRQRMARLEAENQRAKADAARREAEGRFNALLDAAAKKYPQMDRDFVEAKFYAGRLCNPKATDAQIARALDEAAKASHERTESLRKDAVAEHLKTRERGAAATAEGRGGAQPGHDKPPAEWDRKERIARTTELLRGGGG